MQAYLGKRHLDLYKEVACFIFFHARGKFKGTGVGGLGFWGEGKGGRGGGRYNEYPMFAVSATKTFLALADPQIANPMA